MRGMIPFFGPLYQIVMSFIVIIFVFTCVNSFIAGNTQYNVFASVGNTMGRACEENSAGGDGPILYTNFFIKQLYGDSACTTILEAMDEDGKFRTEPACSYENCEGSFCLCMAKSLLPSNFPGHDMVTSGQTSQFGVLQTEAYEDRSDACIDLNNENLYSIAPGSMCCIKVPIDCMGEQAFIVMQENSEHRILDGIYARNGDITITSLNFFIVEQDAGVRLGISKV